MRLTQKLLGFLNRVFDKDPKPFVGLRLAYAGLMTWSVRDSTLTTTVSGGPGQSMAVDLAGHTLASLASVIAGWAGYSVTYLDAARAGLSARVLLEGSGDQSALGGDRVYGYTSLLWAYLESVGAELQAAEVQIREMLRQPDVNTASGAWLDEIGGYYRVQRNAGEIDATYGPRIIAETLRPRGNNNAIANAIEVFTGQPADVVDVTIYGDLLPLYDGTISYDGAEFHDSSARALYGLFDVQYAYDLINGGDLAEFQASVRSLIETMRDAGTHLRALALTESHIEDTLTDTPTDEIATTVALSLADTRTAPTETFSQVQGLLASLGDALTAPDDLEGSLSERYMYAHIGDHGYDGGVHYSGYILRVEPIDGSSVTSETLLDHTLFYDHDGFTITDESGAALSIE